MQNKSDIIWANGKKLTSSRFNINYYSIDLKKINLTYDHNGKLIIYRNIKGDSLHPIENQEHAQYNIKMNGLKGTNNEKLKIEGIVKLGKDC